MAIRVERPHRRAESESTSIYRKHTLRSLKSATPNLPIIRKERCEPLSGEP